MSAHQHSNQGANHEAGEENNVLEVTFWSLVVCLLLGVVVYLGG